MKKMNKSKIKKFFNIGIIKTIRFNYKYFGFDGVRHLYALVSRNTKILKLDGTVELLNPSGVGNISIGFGDVGIIDNKYQRTIWKNSGKVIFEGKTILGPGTRLCNSGEIRFGENVGINANSDIICSKKINFGSGVLLSWEILIMDTDFHKIYDADGNRINSDAAISIGDNVWIGCKSTILKGTNIPNGSIIAACSLVTGNKIEENAIYSTDKILKHDIKWEL